MRARKSRPHACINLIRTHNIPAMTLAKNADTEPNETTYNKSFMAFLLTPCRLNAATRFCSAVERKRRSSGPKARWVLDHLQAFSSSATPPNQIEQNNCTHLGCYPRNSL